MKSLELNFDEFVKEAISKMDFYIKTHCVHNDYLEKVLGDQNIGINIMPEYNFFNQIFNLNNAFKSKVIIILMDLPEELKKKILFELEEFRRFKRELRTLNQLERIVKREKRKGKTIGFTNGCYDVLHKGHFYIVNAGSEFSDIFIVALNSDESVRKLKSKEGDERPKYKQIDRAYCISKIKGVDYVIIFDDDNPLKLLKRLKPDFNIKGGSAIPEKVALEKQIMDEYGGNIINLPLIEGYSSTSTIGNIRRKQ